MMLVAGCLLSLALVDRANAQMFVTYQSPVVPVSTFWAPAPVVYTSYFAPAPVVGFQPVAVARTRYRPILGGTVTRVRPAWSPVVVNPVPICCGY